MNAQIAQYLTHHLSPWALRFNDTIGIRWYNLAYALGFYSSWRYGDRLISRGVWSFEPKEWASAVLWAGAAGLACARLADYVLYDFHSFVSNPSVIFSLRTGGMSSFGGIVGVLVGLWAFSKSVHMTFWGLFDVASITGPVGMILGRLANFANGELWGRPSNVPWAMIFPDAPLVGGINFQGIPASCMRLCWRGYSYCSFQDLSTIVRKPMALPSAPRSPYMA